MSDHFAKHVSYQRIERSCLPQLKVINSVLFPIKYQDKTYEECLLYDDYTLGAFFDAQLVGAITCRLELEPDRTAKLYIITLGVLAPFRRVGIGTHLLQHALRQAAEDPNITAAYLHVHTANESAINFYGQFGFVVKEVKSRYYKRLQPPDAAVLVLKLAC